MKEKEKEKEKDQISFEIMSVVHSHPPSHNIRNIISMTLLETKANIIPLHMKRNKLIVSPAASIAHLCFESLALRRIPHKSNRGTSCLFSYWWVQHPTFMLDWFLATHLLPRRLKSATLNFWIMEGAQKVTFSIHNLYSQMQFRSRMCPEGHWKGFEGCSKRRFELRTRARNSSVFPTKIKDLYDNLQKIIGWDPAAIQKVKGIESKTSSC